MAVLLGGFDRNAPIGVGWSGMMPRSNRLAEGFHPLHRRACSPADPAAS
jgi:hypothetical protein